MSVYMNDTSDTEKRETLKDMSHTLPAGDPVTAVWERGEEGEENEE